MNQVARQAKLPERAAVFSQAKEIAGAIGVHAVAKDDLSVGESRRTSDGKFEERRRTRPLRGGISFRFKRERRNSSDIECTKSGDEQAIIARRRRGDEMVLRFECPQDFGLRRSGLAIDAPGSLRVAARSRPIRRNGRGQAETRRNTGKNKSHSINTFIGCSVTTKSFARTSPLLSRTSTL